MESSGAGYSIKKLSIGNKGTALVMAILISLFALLALAGLYFALTKLLGSSQTIKTYTSVRDAAAGGVHYAVSMIEGGVFNEFSINECTSSPVELNFKLVGAGDELFTNKITVCLLAYYIPPGYEVTGVAYSKEIPDGKGRVYTIISEAEGPQGTRSRIEAVYAK